MSLVLSLIIASGYQGGIEPYLQPNLHDATFVAQIVQKNQAELLKINKDFGQSYRFDTTTIRLKEPFMMRAEAKVEDTSIVYVLDGPHLVIKIPRAGLHTRQDLSRSPGRRQTMLDFGILTPSLFDGLFQAKFVRNDRGTGEPVFDMTYLPSLDDTSRSRIWIDRSKHIITKREWYNQEGRQLATFLYLSPREVDGIWMPTRLEVKNVDNVVAGVTRYDSIRVNTGLSNDLFTIK